MGYIYIKNTIDMKKKIRLTESQLSSLIKKTIKKVLKEDDLGVDMNVDKPDLLMMAQDFKMKLKELIEFGSKIQRRLGGGPESEGFRQYIQNNLEAMNGDTDQVEFDYNINDFIIELGGKVDGYRDTDDEEDNGII